MSEHVILSQLRIIDEVIRNRWAEHLRTQRTTLTSAITDSVPIAVGLWIPAPVAPVAVSQSDCQRPRRLVRLMVRRLPSDCSADHQWRSEDL
eukprot:2917752-Amphidinium_carterae.1